MQVTHSFSYIGQAVSPVLARLGLPAATLLKIKRRLPLEAGGVVPPREMLIGGDSCDQHRDGNGTSGGIGDEDKTISERDVDVATSSGTLGCRKRLGVGWESKAGLLSVSAANATGTGNAAAAATVGAAAAARRGSDRPFVTPRLVGSDDDLGSNNAGTFSVKSVPDEQRTRAPLGFDVSPGVRSSDSPDGASHVDNDQGEHNTYADICPVSPSETVCDGDVLVLSCPRSTMVTFQASVLSGGVDGVKMLGSRVSHLAARGGSLLAALVLSDSNFFVGRRPTGLEHASSSSSSSSSSRYYECRIVAVRHAIASETCATAAATAGTWATADACAAATSAAATSAAAASGGSGRAAASSPSPAGAALTRRSAGEPLAASGEDARVSRQFVSDRYLAPLDPGEDSNKPLRDEEASPELGAVKRETEGAVGRDYQRGLDVARRRLAPGDTVLVLANEGFVKRWKDSRDFDLVTVVGSVPKPVRTYDYLSLLVFGGMLGWVLFSDVVMVSRREVTRGGTS